MSGLVKLHTTQSKIPGDQNPWNEDGHIKVCIWTSGPQVDTEKTKYMLMSHQQNTGQNNKISNISFKNIKKFKYLGMILTYQIACTKKLRTD